MSEPIQCPRCGEDFELSEALSREARNALRAEVAEQYAEREAELERRAAALKARRRKQEEAFEEQLQAERERLAARERKRAQDAARIELEDARAALAESRKERDAAKKQNLDLLKQQAALERARAELDLTVEKRVAEQRSALRKEDAARAAEQQELLRAEFREREATYQRRIDELKRHAEQGSQQLQGEALETSLEDTLRAAFPHDRIEPVPKGTRGADIVHYVVDRTGATCGTILWEFKRTKHWSPQWLEKLRDDQRALKADVPALVSNALPADIETLGEMDGVWIASPRCALGLAAVLRDSILRLTASKKALEGRQGKMELLYAYLTGAEFRQRIEGLVEPFVAMQRAVAQERRAMERIWKAREAQINRALLSMAGLQGDVEGIAGLHLAAMDELDLPESKEGTRGGISINPALREPGRG